MEKSKCVVPHYQEQQESSDNEVDFRCGTGNVYQRYVALGGYATNQDGIFSYFPHGGVGTLSEWRSFFSTCDNAMLLLTFHEFVMDYREGRTPENYGFGQEIYKVLNAHADQFNSFIDKWFVPLPESNFIFYTPTYENFKGLNLNLEGIEDFVDKEYCDEDGNTLKVKFKDGSFMKLVNPGGYLDYDQFFVLKPDYEPFVNDILELVGNFFK